MEIFKITDNQVARQELTGDAPVGTTEETRTEAQELRDAQEMTGEKVTTGTSGTQTEGLVQGEGSFTLGGNSTEKKTVLKVDGPLSRVFTDSLNKILAVENMSMVAMSLTAYESMLKDQAEAGEEVPEVIHVQAYDANDLTNGNVVDISDAIVKTPDEEHVVVTESARGISGSTDALHRLCKSTATRDCVKIETAAGIVAGMLLKKRR